MHDNKLYAPENGTETLIEARKPKTPLFMHISKFTFTGNFNDWEKEKFDILWRYKNEIFCKTIQTERRFY